MELGFRLSGEPKSILSLFFRWKKLTGPSLHNEKVVESKFNLTVSKDCAVLLFHNNLTTYLPMLSSSFTGLYLVNTCLVAQPVKNPPAKQETQVQSGQRNLVGSSLWGRKESDTTEQLILKRNLLYARHFSKCSASIKSLILMMVRYHYWSHFTDEETDREFKISLYR